MRNSHWNDLILMLEGRELPYNPAGFIIDSPWIPGWYGISNIDYYTSDEQWLKANLRAVNSFPSLWFMPGFWSEYGMCTEPSAFGARMIFLEKNLPHAEKIISDISDVARLPSPDVRTDGMLPFMINRLMHNRSAIEEADHSIRFAVSRGPLNIASFLMGTTEFMMALALDPDGAHRLLKGITGFICDWIAWQKKCFDTIDGVLILDDIIGFVGEDEFNEYVLPYFRTIFDSAGVRVRFLHNDAEGLITARYLGGMGVNMFNFSFNHTLREIRELAGPDVILVGNMPPRDVLAGGTPADVDEAVKSMIAEAHGLDRIILSAGGGMPPGVTSDNIKAFVNAVNKYGK